MRCFYVFVHGRLSWRREACLPGEHLEANQPAGFYCHRYVLASDEEEAKNTALRRVRENLDERTRWLGSGLVALKLEVEEVENAPLYKLLKPDNRGHTFYEED